jgi:GNAT superfamily N-acetyltransferase
MNFQVRRLAKPDCEPYKALRLRAFQESSASFSESYDDECQKSLEFFHALLGDSSEHFTVGSFSTADELSGIATFKRDQRQKARHKGFIHTMYVAPEYRGQKIADGILRNIMETARTMPGLEQIHLWVLNPETSFARKLYLKAGFKPQGPMVRNDLFIDGAYVDAEYLTLLMI